MLTYSLARILREAVLCLALCWVQQPLQAGRPQGGALLMGQDEVRHCGLGAPLLLFRSAVRFCVCWCDSYLLLQLFFIIRVPLVADRPLAVKRLRGRTAEIRLRRGKYAVQHVTLFLKDPFTAGLFFLFCTAAVRSKFGAEKRFGFLLKTLPHLFLVGQCLLLARTAILKLFLHSPRVAAASPC